MNKKELIEAILANPVYRPKSGLRKQLTRALDKLSVSELSGLKTIIELKGGIHLE